MTAPAGILKKTKNNDHKKFREREEWVLGKRLGRAKQVFVDTKALSVAEIEALTDAQILALPAPHWEKVSQ